MRETQRPWQNTLIKKIIRLIVAVSLLIPSLSIFKLKPSRNVAKESMPLYLFDNDTQNLVNTQLKLPRDQADERFHLNCYMLIRLILFRMLESVNNSSGKILRMKLINCLIFLVLVVLSWNIKNFKIILKLWFFILHHKASRMIWFEFGFLLFFTYFCLGKFLKVLYLGL